MSIRKFFEERFNYNEDNGKYGKVLDCAVVNLRSAYIAYEIGNAQGKREVIAIVCALDYDPNSEFNFGYKDMDETMGPYRYGCPERILKMLTPTEHEYAKKWRETCWERIRSQKARPQLKKGLIIKFAAPIVFKSGIEEDTFCVVNPRRLTFVSAGKRYPGFFKLSRRTLQNPWEVKGEKQTI